MNDRAKIPATALIRRNTSNVRRISTGRPLSDSRLSPMIPQPAPGRHLFFPVVVKHRRMPIQTDEARDYEFIINLIYQRCRIRLHDGKHQLIKARLGKRMRHRGLETLGQP